MEIYHYNRNFFYVGKSQAQESPLEPGVFLIPKNATPVVLPEFADDELVKFDESTQTWSVQKSLRGKKIWEKATGYPKISLEETLPDNGKYTTKEPPVGSIWDDSQDKWVVTDESYATKLNELKTSAIDLLRDRRNRLRDGGYTLATGVVINTSPTGLASIEGAIKYLEISGESTISWQAKNQWIAADKELLLEFYKKGTAFVQACFRACEAHEANINDSNLDVIDDLLRYDWDTNWPSNQELAN